MIKHIICFKLKDRSEVSRREAQSILKSMSGNVPMAKEVKANIDMLRSPRSYDVILEVLLENWDALEEYQKDPYHVDVVKTYMHSHTEISIAVDYEI